MHKKKLQGTFLVETMVVLPLFVCFAVFLLFHFRVLQVQTSVEAALQYTSRFLAASCYADEEGADADLGDRGVAAILFRKKLIDYGCPTQYIAFGSMGISLAASEIDGDDIALHAVYDMNLPIGVFGRQYYRISQSAVSRKWIGDKRFTAETDDEEWVYITPHGSAYHSSTSCSYLDLSIRSTTERALVWERNASGHRYYPCEVCASSGGRGAVYVTDYGEVYHRSLTCSGLKRTVYMVRISEVEGRHACSKCY